MPFEFGDIVLVRFPFTNQIAFKQRPAVIVSNRTYNIAKPDVIVVAVTSQLRLTTTLGEVLIDDWQGAGLVKSSAIKPTFATFEQSLILKKLGTLQPADRSALRFSIAAILG